MNNLRPVNMVKVGLQDYVNPYAVARIIGDGNKQTSQIKLINNETIGTNENADKVAQTILKATNSENNEEHIFSIFA